MDTDNTVNIRKRNIRFGKPNVFVFGYRKFGFRMFGWLTLQGTKLNIRISAFLTKLDRFIKKLYIKWSSLVNQTFEIWTKLFGFQTSFENRTIWQPNHFPKCRNPNVRFSDFYCIWLYLGYISQFLLHPPI